MEERKYPYIGITSYEDDYDCKVVFFWKPRTGVVVMNASAKDPDIIGTATNKWNEEEFVVLPPDYIVRLNN